MIETHDLTKKYGDLFAIRSIDLDLEKGDLFGFIGPNGAGKTTTMRIIATLLNPTWGEAYVCGNSIYTKPKEIRRLVGYMPDFFGVYDDMKVIEYLEFFAAAYRIKGPDRRKRCERDAGDRRSGLQARRLRQHALPRPDAAAGPGPRAAARSRKCCCWTNRSADSTRGPASKCGTCSGGWGRWARRLSSPATFFPELADICNKIGIIDRGVMNVNAEVADVMKQVRRQTVLHVGLSGSADDAAKMLEGLDIVDSIQSSGNGQLVVTLKEGVEDYSDLPTQLIQQGHRLVEFREDRLSLESAFMALDERHEVTTD